MTTRRSPARLRPGDRVQIHFGVHTVEGIVTSVRGDYLHVSIELEGADSPIDRFVRAADLVPA